MALAPTDTAFSGSIPQLYEQLLVPLIFEPYAIEVAQRVASVRPARVLEIAAGTGALTRQLAKVLPASTEIVATDLNQAMIDHAQSIGTSRPVRWQQADAMKLPFQDASFDLVVCQFGAMFFPDKPAAYAETRRVIEPGGRFVFSVWDAIGENEFTDVAVNALAKLFPRNPPRFLARTPHGYHERSLIAAHLDAGGFSAPAGIETVGARSRAASARIAAAGLCEGTPMRPEIEAFGPQALQAATNAAAEAIAAQFGDGEIDGKIQALIVTVQR